MDKGFLFWLIYVVCAIFAVLGLAPSPVRDDWRIRGGMVVIVFILIGLLGWAVYGPAVR